MFETLFKYPRVLARHREGPVADARERFLVHCAEQGLAQESLLRTAREVLIIAEHIRGDFERESRFPRAARAGDG